MPSVTTTTTAVPPQRLRVPLRGKARRRYFALLGLARTAPPHQRQKLLTLAHGLLRRVEA